MARHDLDNGVTIAMPFLPQPMMLTRCPSRGNEERHVGTGSAVGAVDVAVLLRGSRGAPGMSTVGETPWAAMARIAASHELLVGSRHRWMTSTLGRVTDLQIVSTPGRAATAACFCSSPQDFRPTNLPYSAPLSVPSRASRRR